MFKFADRQIKVITIGLPPSGGALIKAHFFLENMSFDLLTFRL